MYLRNFWTSTALLLTLTPAASAASKDQVCYWTLSGDAPWDLRAVSALVIEQQLDGTTIANDATWTRNQGNALDNLLLDIVKTNYEPVTCQSEENSVLQSCYSTRIGKSYNIGIVEKTVLNYEGVRFTYPEVQLTIINYSTDDAPFIIETRTVLCSDYADFESVVDGLLSIR